jgi:SAM-dependent methyltransferase
MRGQAWRKHVSDIINASPELIFADLFAVRRTAALKAAIELDIFTAIGEGADTAEAIAATRGLAVRGGRILCDFLTVAGHLTKDAGRYRLPPATAAFLDRRSPAWIGGAASFIASKERTDMMLDDPAGFVRRGGTTQPSGGMVAPDNPAWVAFARHMAPMMARPAEVLASLLDIGSAERLDVLDIAAGHGQWGIAVALRNSRATLTALDWPAVLDVAEARAADFGLAERFIRLPGDAFAVDLGKGRDLVLVPNFLHHFDIDTCIGFLKRVRAALAPGGRVAIVDFMPDDDRVSPADPASFAFTMLAATESGDAYTAAEHRAMLAASGLANMVFHNLVPTPMTVAIALA